MNFLLSSGPKLGVAQRRWIPQYIPDAPPVAPEAGPTLTSPPVLNGIAVEGQVLTYTPGVYAATETLTVYIQWTVDGADIEGETGSTFIPRAQDVGLHIAVRETASTGFGLDCIAVSMASVCLATTPSAVPQAPTGVTASAPAAGQMLVSWTPPDNAADGTPLVPPITYTVYHSTTSGVNFPGGPGTTAVAIAPGNLSRLLTGLPAGTHYATVTATNTVGEGFESFEVSVTVT